jgi:hypothetical protein
MSGSESYSLCLGRKTEYGKHIELDIGKMLSSQGRVLRNGQDGNIFLGIIFLLQVKQNIFFLVTPFAACRDASRSLTLQTTFEP